MKEIYWLSRLDGILTASGILLTLSVIAILCMVILKLIEDDDVQVMSAERKRKIMKSSTIICIITSLICSFVPSSKTAMAIWGVGTVIDYVQENETLHELPDKCVKALEIWANSFNEEEERK